VSADKAISVHCSLPVIVRSLKFTKIESYLIPVPIYFGACLWTIINCHISDKRRRRAEHVAGPFLLGILGLIFTMSAEAKPGLIGLTMTGLVFVVFGAYSATPPSLAWVASNYPEVSLRFGQLFHKSPKLIIYLLYPVFSLTSTLPSGSKYCQEAWEVLRDLSFT